MEDAQEAATTPSQSDQPHSQSTSAASALSELFPDWTGRKMSAPERGGLRRAAAVSHRSPVLEGPRACSAAAILGNGISAGVAVPGRGRRTARECCCALHDANTLLPALASPNSGVKAAKAMVEQGPVRLLAMTAQQTRLSEREVREAATCDHYKGPLRILLDDALFTQLQMLGSVRPCRPSGPVAAVRARRPIARVERVLRCGTTERRLC